MKEAGLAPARRSPDLEPAGSARPLVLSRVHWVRPELDLKALLLRENQAFYSARECRHVGSLLTPRWRKGDSNCRSLSRECRLIFAEEKGLQVVIRVVKTDRPFSRGDQRFESSSLRRQVTLSSHFSITRTTWAAPAPRQAFLASVAGASCTPWTSARYALASRRRTRRGQSSGFRLRLSGVGRVSSICCETLGAPSPLASAPLLVSSFRYPSAKRGNRARCEEFSVRPPFSVNYCKPPFE